MTDLALPAPDAWMDDEPTLVHPREVSEVRALRSAAGVAPAAPIPPPLPASLRRVHRELAPDDLWLASLPAATRAMLERVRTGAVVPAARVVAPLSAS